MTTSTAIAARIADPIDHIKISIARCAAAIAAAWLRRRTYSALSSLDDRMLKDIGIDRTMVLRVSMSNHRT